MKQILYLECLVCGAHYAPDEVDYVCPKHGNEGILDVVYDYERIGWHTGRDSLQSNPDQTIWRYRALLPLRP